MVDWIRVFSPTWPKPIRPHIWMVLSMLLPSSRMVESYWEGVLLLSAGWSEPELYGSIITVSWIIQSTLGRGPMMLCSPWLYRMIFGLCWVETSRSSMAGKHPIWQGSMVDSTTVRAACGLNRRPIWSTKTGILTRLYCVVRAGFPTRGQSPLTRSRLMRWRVPIMLN